MAADVEGKRLKMVVNGEIMPENVTISVTINGEEQALEAAVCLEDLLVILGLTKGKVAIERNLEIVPRSLYGETMVQDGDRLEIVHFIGGG